MVKYYDHYRIAIYPYMTDLKITRPCYNLPNVSQGFSDITVVIIFYNSCINSHCVIFVYLECSTSWTLCHQRGLIQVSNILYLIMTCQNRLWLAAIATLIISLYGLTSKWHNLDTIFLMCGKVSPTLQVVMKFYNSFINSHWDMFMYPECSTSWTLYHWKGPSQCLQCIMVESKSLSAERAVTKSSIYYADIKITMEGYANAITILLRQT